jgi:hypothetical protein
MKKILFLIPLLLLIFIFSCGGGSSSGSGGGAAPVLQSISFSPSTARTNTLVNLTATFNYSDADGDLDGGSFVVSAADGSQGVIPIPSSFQGSTSGTGSLRLSSTTSSTAGIYPYQVWLIDRRGNRSNILIVNFTIT